MSNEGKFRNVSHYKDTKADLDMAVSVPYFLSEIDDDGKEIRRFSVKSWKPVVEVGSCVTATAEVFVMIKDIDP